jgi:hypothetical protein
MPKRRFRTSRTRHYKTPKWLTKRRSRYEEVTSNSDDDNPYCFYSEDVLGFAQRFDAAWRKTVEGIVEAGQVLKEAKDELGYGGYGSFIGRIKLNERIAQMLMTIANNGVIRNPKNFSALPPKYTSLYRLCLLGEDELQELIDAGNIHRFMRGKEVTVLVFKTLERVPELLKRVATMIKEWKPDHLATVLHRRFLWKPNNWTPPDREEDHRFEVETNKMDPCSDLEDAPDWFKEFNEAWKRVRADFDHDDDEDEDDVDA